ncbi:MAG: hypothetical protein ACRDGA_01580, partial [Bacteroidota bacterium]
LLSTKLAFYPATALFLLSCAVIVRQPLVRILLWLASAHFMFHLAFLEGLGLITHSLAQQPRSLLLSGAVHLIYILFFSLWSFPFLLGFAAIRYDSGVDYFWLSRFKRRRGLVLVGSALVLWTGVLTIQPTFTELWKQPLRVEQRLSLDSPKGAVTLESKDYLGGLTIRFDGADTTLNGRVSTAMLKEFEPPRVPWLTVERRFTALPSDSSTNVELSVTIKTLYRPYTLRVAYSSSSNRFSEVSSPLAFSVTEQSINLRWYSFPDTMLTIPLRFTITGGDSIHESIEATFVEKIDTLRVENHHASTTYRSIINSSAILCLTP